MNEELTLMELNEMSSWNGCTSDDKERVMKSTIDSSDLEFGVVLDGCGKIVSFDDEKLYSEDQKERIGKIINEWVERDFIPLSVKTDIFCFNLSDEEVGCFNVIGRVFDNEEKYSPENFGKGIDVFIYT